MYDSGIALIVFQEMLYSRTNLGPPKIDPFRDWERDKERKSIESNQDKLKRGMAMSQFFCRSTSEVVRFLRFVLQKTPQAATATVHSGAKPSIGNSFSSYLDAWIVPLILQCWFGFWQVCYLFFSQKSWYNDIIDILCTNLRIWKMYIWSKQMETDAKNKPFR